jgi:hypothetical protein
VPISFVTPNPTSVFSASEARGSVQEKWAFVLGLSRGFGVEKPPECAVLKQYLMALKPARGLAAAKPGAFRIGAVLGVFAENMGERHRQMAQRP